MKRAIETGREQGATGSYLLHIYRCSPGDDELVGTLERLGDGEKASFHDLPQLLRLLRLQDPESGGRDHEHK